ncbi:MAG: carboxypeptidase-like regulatory domain-containing protein, partial [Thermoplasmata archaeon]|nr:carboxypeptidase-like regulatory domain-containing protein [Thermoplasmata archaeon]
MTRTGTWSRPVQLLALGIALGMVGTVLVGVAPATGAGAPLGTHLASSSLGPHSASLNPAVGSTFGLPGSDPVGEISVPAHFQPTGFPVHEPPTGSMPGYRNDTLAPTSPGHRVVHSAAPNFSGLGGNVTVMGTVLEGAVPHRPAAGALITVETIGSSCQLTNGCATTLTAGNGNFSIGGIAPGTIQVTVSAPWNVTNYTTLFDVPSGLASTGIIYILPDAVVSGCVEGVDSTHEPAAGIEVTGFSRLGGAPATPAAITNSQTGCFDSPGVPIPPGPAVLDFNSTSPYPIYEDNFTDLDLQPGQHYTLPAPVYMNVGVRVVVEPYDTVTKALINESGFITISIVHRPSGFGLGWGQPVLESQVAMGVDPAAFALPGLSTLSLGADGYADNESSVVIPDVPYGETVNLGKVWLVPDGVITGTFGFEGSPGIESSPWYAATVHHDFVVMNVCSLSGYRFASSAPNVSVAVASDPTNANVSFDNCVSTCQPLGEPFAAWATPLRVAIGYQPDTKGLCGPEANPYVGLEPGWPIPDDLPVFGNYFGSNFSFANITPDLETPAGEIDFTAGTYIQGTTGPGDSWSVEICSTDESVVCMDPAGPIDTAGIYGPCTAARQGNFSFCPDDPLLCPSPTSAGASQTFCAPAPQGPDQISVSSPTQGTNVTWAYVPADDLTSGPLPLAEVSTFHVQSINLSAAPPNLTGEIRNGLTFSPIPDDLSPLISLAPAGQAPGIGSTTNAVGGNFVLNATPGWVAITAGAANYESNVTWVQVNDSRPSQTIGPLNLTPLAWLEGQVLSA